MRHRRCRTNSRPEPGTLDRICPAAPIAAGSRSEFGSARPRISNGSRFQFGLILTLFSYSVLALSGCGEVKLVTHNTRTFTATPSAVAFGDVLIGQASKATISIQAGSSG